MNYKVYLHATHQHIASIKQNWPRISVGDPLPISVGGKEETYIVTELGADKMEMNQLITDLWVKPG